MLSEDGGCGHRLISTWRFFFSHFYLFFGTFYAAIFDTFWYIGAHDEYLHQLTSNGFFLARLFLLFCVSHFRHFLMKFWTWCIAAPVNNRGNLFSWFISAINRCFLKPNFWHLFNRITKKMNMRIFCGSVEDYWANCWRCQQQIVTWHSSKILSLCWNAART